MYKKNIRNFDKWLRQYLIDSSIVSNEHMTELEKEVNSATTFHEVIHNKKILTTEELIKLASSVMDYDVINLEEFQLNETVMKILPKDVQEKFIVLPLSLNNETRTLRLALSDPSNLMILDTIKSIAKIKPMPVFCLSYQIKLSIENYNKKNDINNIIEEMNNSNEIDTPTIEEEQKLDNLNDNADEPAIVRIVNSILNDAVTSEASDIHIEPNERNIRVRLRVDGILIEKIKDLDKKHLNAIISRIKIMSDLDITEHRKPQDGRFKVRIGHNTIDIRVSTMPTQYGEKIVMRLTNKSISISTFENLGFDDKEIEILKDCVDKPYGLILTTGPTGSGKSTTLYGLLSYLNSPDVNIVTVEDPIERQIYGITQTSVDTKIGYTFANGLKTILRQDPDIIMVGEIRDTETADMAIQAALTGHLVLSTLHTNDAAGSLTRMMDMGIEPFKIPSALLAVIAQRLARKICTYCVKEYTPSSDELLLLRSLAPKIEIPDDVVLKKGCGCIRCSNTGYKGRVGIYEILKVEPEIKEYVIKGASEKEIKDKAVELGMKTMQTRGVEKILDGTTTLEEIRKIVFY